MTGERAGSQRRRKERPLEGERGEEDGERQGMRAEKEHRHAQSEKYRKIKNNETIGSEN